MSTGNPIPTREETERRQAQEAQRENQTDFEAEEVHSEDEVDDASMDSFPASDPPGWTPMTSLGPPCPSEEDEKSCSKRRSGQKK